jgi:hypothetical protein
MTDIRPLTPADPDLGSAALRYLARNEAMNCVQIGLMLPFMRSEYESTWYVAIEGQAIAGVASQGGPFNIILSGMEPATAAALAPVLQRDVPGAPGLLGPRDVVHAYVEAADRPIATHMENGVYACTQVMWPESVPDGSARFANDHDLPWMIEWMTRFHIDVGEDVAREDATNAMTGKLRTGGRARPFPSSGTATRRRAASALALSTRRRSTVAEATPPMRRRSLPSTSSTVAARSSSSTPTSPIRPRTIFISRSATSTRAT